jgi:hypothetical protein
MAAREGCGWLVWLSWEPKTNKKYPEAGTTLLGITKKAAVAILAELQTRPKPRHFDNWLADNLHSPRSQEFRELKQNSCYLWNPIGGYQAHESGCEKNLFRVESWDRWQSWPVNTPGKPARWMVMFGREGQNVSRKVCNAADHPGLVVWRTYIPPEMRGEDGLLDQKKMDRLLAPDSGFEQNPRGSQEEEGPPVSAQPRRDATEEAATSTQSACPAALPGEEWQVVLEGPREDDLASIFTVEEAEGADWAVSDTEAPSERSAPGPPAADQTEKKRKRRTAPVDVPGLGPEVEATRHRVRGRRKAAHGYFSFRRFVYKQDPMHMSLFVSLFSVVFFNSHFAQTFPRRAFSPWRIRVAMCVCLLLSQLCKPPLRRTRPTSTGTSRRSRTYRAPQTCFVACGKWRNRS